VTAPEFVLYHFAREAPEVPRIGFAVSRRVGGSVVRNRARRVLREAVRSLIPRLVACDIVVVARPPVAWAGVADLETSLADAASRAGLLLTDRQDGASSAPVNREGTSS
jgi:ribonuclease P protein component